MSNSVNDIPTGLRVPAQIPLDAKVYKLSEADLANLGPGYNLAYTYYKGMSAYCAQEQTRWEWREKGVGQVGLIVGDFTYPSGLTIFGINYSNKVYNFFPLGGATFVATPPQLLTELGMAFDWKKGAKFSPKVQTDLPEGVTDNVYQRFGYVGYAKPEKVGSSVKHPISDRLFQAIVDNLGINIKNFNTIQDYSPVLVISKYTPTTRKETKTPELIPGTTTPFPAVTWRKGSYKFSADEDPVRLTRVPIQAQYQVIDFGQEHYFATTKKLQDAPSFIGERVFATRAIGRRYSQVIKNYPILEAGFTGSDLITNKTFVYLQFHIEITVNNVQYLSNALGRLKMLLIAKFVPGTTYTYAAGDTIPAYFNGEPGEETRIYFKHT